MDKVFIFYSCDEWKSRDSMRLEKIFADSISGRLKLADYINEHRQDYELRLTYKECLIASTNITPTYINDYITYGFIESEYVEG